MIVPRQSLTCTPKTGSLPCQIALQYAVSSTAAPEQVTVSYALDPANDVCFGSGGKVFSVAHAVTAVDPTAQTLTDRAVLVPCGPGNPGGSIIIINQTITDGAGRQLHDACAFTIV
jgi:hypothetical protein